MNYKDWYYLTTAVTMDMNRYKEEAVQAIMQIIAHESNGGKYWEQQGGGPALGPIQMEPITHDSIWDNSDSIYILAKKLMIRRDVEQLRHSAIYNIFMARCYLLMDTRPLPKDGTSMSYYLKKYWNSEKGKAEPLDYFYKWNRWREGKL
ncbi:endolysin [Alteromonas phage ZP6]|uniref:Putative endolysin n=1 Tax=Alteromonas phage ZP6 TaxID=2492447 RepID=A0A3S9U8G4_9CAUD|nr:endolysin [Alteromonas phage ZP6]AZS06533.1 endolysin [Alteromonas phage ZP6]